MDAIPQVNERKIYYHTDVFSCPKKTALLVVGLAAVTALVIGMLALLHAQGIINAGAFGSIPQWGTYSLLGGGGGLLLADVIALIILDVKHRRVIAEQEKIVDKSFPENLAASSYTCHYHTTYLSRPDGTEEIHQFSSWEASNAFDAVLAKKGFRSQL